MDTLVDLHEVDPAAVGLARVRPSRRVPRPAGPALAPAVAGVRDRARCAELARRVELLNSTLPEQSAPAIVHGDYRLTNVMFAPRLDRIAAVVDWEMATLGDPLADVGLLLVYQDWPSRRRLRRCR